MIGPSGILKRKTRVLVTHSIGFLPQMDRIVVMKEGKITETGTYHELLRSKGAFAEFLLEQMKEEREKEENDEGETTAASGVSDSDEIKLQLEEVLGEDKVKKALRREKKRKTTTKVGVESWVYNRVP